MSKTDHLTKALTDATRIVEEWAANIRKIESALANANTRLEESEARRKEFALDASLENPQAIEEITKARAEHANSDQEIADLQHALGGARLKLAAAEKAEASARYELAHLEAGCLARERVKIAAKIDALISEFSAALASFDELGNRIVHMPGLLPSDPRAPGMTISRTEEIEGNRRVRSALPRVWLRFFPGALHEERAKMTLEASEIQTWGRLALVETNEAKAA
jgi:hypothetical protein